MRSEFSEKECSAMIPGPSKQGKLNSSSSAMLLAKINQNVSDYPAARKETAYKQTMKNRLCSLEVLTPHT
jgi:hypothetical protein